MTSNLEIYKCETCGNIVEVLHAGGGVLVCCGADMKLMKEQTADQATEKHVPVVERGEDGSTVTVGSTPHPMEDAHYIEWIQMITPDGVYSPRKFLKPGEAAEAKFKLASEGAIAREYCSVHGLWRS